MSSASTSDYSLLDHPSILGALFHPRPALLRLHGLDPERLSLEERVRFWVVTSALAVLVGVVMLRRGASPWLTALVVLAWMPSVSFLGLGIASVARQGLGARSAGALAGSGAWWALVVAAGLGAVIASRPLMR